MYAVICSPNLWDEIEQAITSKGEQVLFKAVDTDIDIIEEFEKISRLAIKYLIIDITSIADNKQLIHAVRRFRITNDNAQIIIIAPNCQPGNEILHTLVTMGIYDIISPTADNISDMTILDNLSNMLDNPSPYKKAVKWLIDGDITVNTCDVIKGKDNVKVKEKIIEVEKTVLKTVKQQILTFYTTDNSLYKDDLLTQTAFLLAKKSKQKILVIDLNILTPTLDNLFGINKDILINDIYNTSGENTGLKAVYNAIEKNIFAPELLEELAIKHSKFNNLYILTGLYDINLFEKLNIEHYKKLIDAALEIYDTVIINTHPDISIDATYFALKRATTIIAISDANYTYARNMNFIINYLVEYHKIPRNKFKIVVNNISKFSLDKEYMKRLFEEYEIIACIPFNHMREVYLNKQKSPFIFSKAASKDVINYLYIIESLGYIPKISFMDKIFKGKKKIINEICTEDTQVR